MDVAADSVAQLVQAQYARLPKTGKPQQYSAGGREWTILAGVVLTEDAKPPQVVSLGTGTKCLTAAQVDADVNGDCLHDAHAEVCARRALLAFLLHELRKHGRGTPAASTQDLPSEESILQPVPGGGGFELRQPACAQRTCTGPSFLARQRQTHEVCYAHASKHGLVKVNQRSNMERVKYDLMEVC